MKDDRLASLLEYGTQAEPGGAVYEHQIIERGDGGAEADVLMQNGYYEPVVTSDDGWTATTRGSR